jgi:hypothetical protein
VLGCLTALLAGCGGSGWVRIEPEAYQPAVATQTFEDVEAVSTGPLDKDRVNRPIMLTAESKQEGPSGDVIRSWRLLALAVPGDGTSRTRIFALVGRSVFSRPLRWQLYSSNEAGLSGSQAGLANWRYNGWVMLYGPVAAADIREASGSTGRVFSASLKMRVNGDAFREQAQTMIDTLKKLRSPPPPTTQRSTEVQPAPPPEAVELYDDAIRTLRKLIATTQPESRGDSGTRGRRDTETRGQKTGP